MIAVIVRRNGAWEIWSDLTYVNSFPRCTEAEAYAEYHGYSWIVRS